ncbi:AarF/ABC1/UbiB kinase family protein [uncultured Thermanaerothrix sp.]|uniref:ABC1 kinase family protein n=1 Tax=uncultured Thermanaerothrix sp. TaxID=1195149 RepID=UPI0026132622|nr:AarF/ABC1/UbiB kinase family protein [uncultured Thermanaerothrix sp.]
MLRARYRRILRFFAGVILHVLTWDILLPRFGLGKLVRTTRPQRLRRLAAAFRQLAIQLGGVMIKVGQFLSTRIDILPPEITEELSGLQDEVAPEPFDAIRAVVETEFGAPLATRFLVFEESPLAAASIGQVHRAWLNPPHTTSDPTPLAVVVKVQRPNIPAIVETDLQALRVVARWVNLFPPVRRRADVPALVDEFSRILREEIDYLSEARHAEIFAANFAGHTEVRIPKVYWEYTTRRVLTLEDVGDIKITDYPAIEAAGIERAEVAKRLITTYLKQIFEDGFFHADPHPGNLFVHPLPSTSETDQPPSRSWQLVFVDFGMTGTVPPDLMEALREVLVGIASRDATRLVQAYQQMGILLPNADLRLIEKATQEVFDRFWGKTLAEISMSQEEVLSLLVEFRQLLYQMPFQLPQNLLLLGRCLSILNGICLGLDPQFNVWESVVPYAERMMRAEQESLLRPLLKTSVQMLRTLIALPQRADAVLTRLAQGQLEVSDPILHARFARLERSARQISTAVVFTALLLSATQLALNEHYFAAAVAGLGALLALLLTLLPR